MTTIKTAHTPGPWYAQAAGKNYWITTAKGLDETVSCLAGTDPQGWPREANARVLAAAPELLTALEDIVVLAGLEEWYTATTGRQMLFRAAEAAIKKARGER